MYSPRWTPDALAWYARECPVTLRTLGTHARYTCIQGTSTPGSHITIRSYPGSGHGVGDLAEIRPEDGKHLRLAMTWFGTRGPGSSRIAV